MPLQSPPQPNDEPRVKRAHRQEDSIKETLESIVMAFVLAFVFRAYVVEAFVIPTGSMAPTLLGAHLRAVCPQCGYTFTCDWPVDSRAMGSDRVPVPLAQRTNVRCPMCFFDIFFAKHTASKSGDRILVHKYIYSVSEPRRCDVVVFKNPSNPQTNYIKRLMGLPHERLWIIDGNIYVQPTGPGEDDAAWRIARKTERLEVQRAVWQPIHDSRYVPLDGGIGPNDDEDHPRWAVPWHADVPEQWEIAKRRSYRHKADGPGTLRFGFKAIERNWSGAYPYNQVSLRYAPQITTVEPIEDVRIAVLFQPDGEGLSVALTTTIRPPNDTSAGAEPVPVIARIDAEGRCSLELVDPTTDELTVRYAGTPDNPVRHPFPAGRATSVELWYVDQEASLWIEGRCILRWQFELDFEVIKWRPFTDRDGALHRPQIRIDVDGPTVTLGRVQIDRDLYYSAPRPRNGSTVNATLIKRIDSTGRVIDLDGQYIELGPDQFFCLGDNSPRSSDGRMWTREDLNPWIRARMFDEHSQMAGIVPRKLLMGRAFFVYFPPPYTWHATRWIGLVPNFGDLRFIH